MTLICFVLGQVHCSGAFGVFFYYRAYKGMGFPGGLGVKNPPAKQEMWVPSLGQEDPLQKKMAAHSSILAWEIPQTEKFDGL